VSVAEGIHRTDTKHSEGVPEKKEWGVMQEVHEGQTFKCWIAEECVKTREVDRKKGSRNDRDEEKRNT